jgi:hypothetical protein
MIKMVKQEKNPEYFTHNIYSKWHRTLSEKCYMYDLDAVEVRSGRGIVAIIETKTQYPNSRSTVGIYKNQEEVYTQIAKGINVPFYFIRIYCDYEEKITGADIYQSYPKIDKPIKERILEKELRAFIEAL